MWHEGSLPSNFYILSPAVSPMDRVDEKNVTSFLTL